MDLQPKHSLHRAVFDDLVRSSNLFQLDYECKFPTFSDLDNQYTKLKSISEYGQNPTHKKFTNFEKKTKFPREKAASDISIATNISSQETIVQGSQVNKYFTSSLPQHIPLMRQPKNHQAWKLYRVISGHYGWVRCVDVEPNNQWFVTGSSDRMIKIWNLSSGTLMLSLTGHISTVRDVVVSKRHPYFFSCGEDKQIKCWDAESNKVIRHYHGHLSGVYCLNIHPTLDILLSGGRDSVVNVWDMRTKLNIHALSGHTNTVSSVKSRATDPQVISSSHDSTIRLWDLAAGRTFSVLTNHKKSVRSLGLHPKLNAFMSTSTNSIKQWVLPDGTFNINFLGQNTVINTIACNEDDVVVSGGDNGTLFFWDFNSGHCFQKTEPEVQSGSLSSEAGIYDIKFDKSGYRLITCNVDKTIKMYKESADVKTIQPDSQKYTNSSF
ncbi:MAG: Pleiotropic regulator 1 [Paramarteilia canceri]